jgi:hypothetical protein
MWQGSGLGTLRMRTVTSKADRLSHRASTPTIPGAGDHPPLEECHVPFVRVRLDETVGERTLATDVTRAPSVNRVLNHYLLTSQERT